MNNTTTPSLQEKTINLKKYSAKIKSLYFLAKNDASLRSQILAKAKNNSVKSNSSYPASCGNPSSVALGFPQQSQSGWLNINSPSQSLIDLSTQLPHSGAQRKEQGLALLPQHSNKVRLSVSGPCSQAGPQNKDQDLQGRRIVLAPIKTKTPLVRISRRLHRHIKSVFASGAAEKINSVTQSITNNNTIVYNFNNNFKKFKLTSILENSFFSMNRLISKPVINIKPNKIIIHLFFYLNRAIANKQASAQALKLSNLLKSKSIQLQALCAFLSKNLKKPVEFELIRLHHPSLESNILANTIGHIAKNTRKTFRVIMLKLFKSIKIKKFNEFKHIYNIRKFKPTALVGIRIKLGGRLLSQKIVPRFTSRTIQRGNLGKTKADFISTSRFTNKNKRGAFSFTVTMGHKFF